jgi:YidC/Oxa1 family membrane protein insertase
VDKKQLYIVMGVSVLFLLGIIGYRWIFGDKNDAEGNKSKPPVTTPAAGKKVNSKTVVAAKGSSVAKGKKRPAVKGLAIGPTKAISDDDLRVEGVTDLKLLRKRYGWAVDRSKTKAAKIILDRAVSLAATDAQLVDLGRLACERGLDQSAKRAVARLIAAAPIKAYHAAYLGGLCAITGKKPVAAPGQLRKALVLAKSDVHRARVLTLQCRLAVDAKQVAIATGRCKGALDKGGDRRAMFQAARLDLLGNDKSPKAVTLLERALRLDRLQTDVARELSAVQVRLGLKAKAVLTLMSTATALSKAGRHHGALAHFQRAVGLAPKSAKTHLGVARSLRTLGKNDLAEKAYRRAGDLAKGNVVLRVELATLLQKKSVLDAVRVLEDAQQIDPASKPVQEALSRVRSQLAGKQPPRYRQHITRVEGKLLKINFTSWGGTPRDVILKSKRYREFAKGVSKKGKKGKEQQVNLVRTWDPYWYPLRLDFDGSSFRVPPFPRRHPRPTWQYQSWDRLRWDGKKFVLHRGKGSHVVKRRGKQVFGYRWPVVYPGMAPAQVVIERIYEVDLDNSYAWDMEVRVINRSATKQSVDMRVLVPSVDAEKENRSFFNPVSLKKEAVCMVGDKVFMRTLSSIRGSGEGCMGCDASTCACRRTPSKQPTFTGKVRWIGIDEMYFLFAVAMDVKKDVVCRLSDDDHVTAKGKLKAKAVLMASIFFDDEKLPHKGSVHTWRFKVYSGPKISDELSKVRLGSLNPKLEESIDYGLFWFIGQPMIWMMKQIQKVVGNWGIAIILLTILIKLLTAPLTMKQMRSMKGMADLKPEIDKLKEECGEDKQRFQQEMWALYKSHKINPLSGCLPMVLQMPIYIAWYQALMVSVDLYRAPLFGWIGDLTKPDVAFHVAGHGIPILPLLMGATMFLQQRMTPTTADNQQAKMMMYMMPAMFTFFMLFLPSGLTLYILTNTVLTMVHQWYMNHSD